MELHVLQIWKFSSVNTWIASFLSHLHSPFLESYFDVLSPGVTLYFSYLLSYFLFVFVLLFLRDFSTLFPNPSTYCFTFATIKILKFFSYSLNILFI